MGTLNLRAALFLAFAAFLVVQCSGDSSEQVEEPSDEIKQLLSNPEMPSDEPSDRRKRSPFGDFFSALFRRNGGRGTSPPPANSTGRSPHGNSSDCSSDSDESSNGWGRWGPRHGGWRPWGSRRGGNGWGPRRVGPPPANNTGGGALRPDFPPDFPIGNSTYSPEEFFRLIGRKKRSPNGDSSESSSDTSGESNDVPPEV
ncbi:hypothetical protein GPALN_005067 [Globodera pallida]|nr:hypothetical protein GPALN_005067 [Globodera pallida]